MSKKTKRPAEAVAAGSADGSRLWVAGIAVLLLILYWQAASFLYLIPGESTLIGNAAIVERQDLSAAFSDKVPWQPLAWISHMADFAMFGAKPGPQRIVNLLLHIANALLVLAAFRRMTGLAGRSAVLALLFAVHPLRVEPVLWLIERRTLLATLFTLLALWIYAAPSGRGKRPAVFVTCLLAALSHPVGAVAPLLLLLVDVWPLQRAAPLTSRLMEKAELAIPAALTIGMSLRGAAPPEALWTNGVYDAATRLWHGVAGLGMALIKTVLPFSLDILNALEPPIAAGAAGLAVLAGAVIALRKPALTAGALWFLAAALPAIGIAHPEIAPWRDSGFYLAHIGLLAALVWLAAEWDEDKAVAAAVVLGLIWAGLSWVRIGEWRTSELLLRNSVERNGHPLAHYQLGQLLLGAERPAEAEKSFLAVTAQRPKAVEPLLLLGTARQMQRRNGDAAEAYRKAIEAAPQRADGYFGLGLMQTLQNQPKEGMENLSLAIERGLAPEQEAQARNAVGLYLLNQKRYQEAVPHLERSWQLVPAYASAHRNYALALDGLGQSAKAFRHLESRARLYTKDADEVVEVWGMLYNKLSEREKAKIEIEEEEKKAIAAKKKK